jgi:flagellar basal body-associated protein FliL
MILPTTAVPLQAPGGFELIVILLIVLIPLAIVAGAVYFLRRRRARAEELESRVDAARSDSQD